MDSKLNAWSPRVLSVLRIIVGFLIIAHGAQKLFGVLGAPGGPVPIASQFGLAGIIEFYGGALLLLGLFTRPAAFLLSGTLAVAYFQVHAKGGFWPIMNKGELAVLYCFVFFYFVFAGAGPWSLDSLIWRRKSAPAATS